MKLRACLPLLLLALAPIPASASVITLDSLRGGSSTVATQYAGSFIADDSGGTVLSLPSGELQGPAYSLGIDQPSGGVTSVGLPVVGQPGPDAIRKAGSAPSPAVTVPEPGSLTLTLVGGIVAFLLLGRKRVRTSIG